MMTREDVMKKLETLELEKPKELVDAAAAWRDSEDRDKWPKDDQVKLLNEILFLMEVNKLQVKEMDRLVSIIQKQRKVVEDQERIIMRLETRLGTGFTKGLVDE